VHQRRAGMVLVFAAGIALGVWLRPYAGNIYRTWQRVTVQPPPPLDPQFYAVRSRQFAWLDPRASSAQVVYLGDSITDWMVVSELVSVERGTVLNRAIAGDTSSGLLARVKEAFPAGVAVCLIMIGRNDLDGGAAPDETADRILQIARLLIEQQGVQHVVVESMLPFMAPNAVAAVAVNDRLRLGVPPTSAALSFLDLYPSFLRDGQPDPALYADSTHLNERGIERRLHLEVEHLSRVKPEVHVSLNLPTERIRSAL
jgi:lysophospholipase L1-like esterase